MKKLTFASALLLVLGVILNSGLSVTSAMAAEKDGIMVMDAWSRARPGGSMMGGAFATIENKSDHPDRLVSVSSPVADKVQIHESVMQGGVMKMLERDEIVLSAGQKVMLKPGSFHVMLMGLKKDLTKGVEFPLTFHFERAGDITVKVHVKDAGAMGGMGKMKMN
ncbi:MAG: copper chaperone PCu(A)C [Alphaproteobacteria bacterium]|nr:MAG: copper chaperone PCu(A)C [Alphaproteobacteria bacterium]